MNKAKAAKPHNIVDSSYFSIIAEGRGSKGMDIFLRGGGGETYYLMPHRYSDSLFFLLKQEISVRALRNLKPRRSYYAQSLLHSVNHILKVVDYYVKYELQDAA
jgi:hypothetical protein